MPKAAILFSVLLLSVVIGNSYALTSGDLISLDVQNPIIFDSDIIEIDSNFFVENNFKRYLIFGNNSQKIDSLQNNSIYEIQSDSGFFSVSVLSEKSASSLASQGYHIIEDSKLDFHSSDDVIQDASRIGEITGSTIA